jgi:hypothetical protein
VKSLGRFGGHPTSRAIFLLYDRNTFLVEVLLLFQEQLSLRSSTYVSMRDTSIDNIVEGVRDFGKGPARISTINSNARIVAARDAAGGSFDFVWR